MVRRVPEARFAQLIEAATRVFIEQGYRRTQMADIAEALGVAKGTLYGYVENGQSGSGYNSASDRLVLPQMGCPLRFALR